MENENKRWMKPKEAADYLSINLHNVYRLLSAHQLPEVKLKGITWRIDRKRLDYWIEEEMEEKERRWRKIFHY